MKTPINDFVNRYLQRNVSRFHMPGHKGVSFLGCEPLDITEVAGADILSEAAGIIKESQTNAASLFHAGVSFYATEGSSQCIKAMLALALFAEKAVSPWILAARNIHRSMVDGCALLDIEICFPEESARKSICSSQADAGDIENILSKAERKPLGVYITSPDYLGIQADISAIADVCKRYEVPLLVDNAHGAYLAFLEPSRHPIALGASLCCDSAHKTLPVLTGGAYLHISEDYREQFEENVSKAMTLFGSTSPSYLTLQSLDLCNRYLSEGYKERLSTCAEQIADFRDEMRSVKITVRDSEPLKLVIDTMASGYTGNCISDEMREQGIECEYADRQFVVLMLTPENTESDFRKLTEWIRETRLVRDSKPPLKPLRLPAGSPQRAMSIREAVFARSERIPVSEALGRVLAEETVSCPPAIPIGISGEIIDEDMIQTFLEYDIRRIAVVCLS